MFETFTDTVFRQSAELLVVDGGHGFVLMFRFRRVAPVAGLWDEYKSRYPDYIFIEDKTATGTAVAIKPPFARYEVMLG